VFENDQGTLDGCPDTLGPGFHLSVAWSGNRGGSGPAIAAWLKVVSAESTRQAMDIVRECQQPTLCWVFADREGHIGLQTCGRFPRRTPPYNGLTPIPAWDEANHWSGWLDSSHLPSVYDPPEGFLATANEEINPPGLPVLVTQLLPGYRKRRVTERLALLPQATLADMQAMQYDLFSLQARELLDVFLPHLPDSPLKQRLEAWDCCYRPESREATLFQRLYVHVIYEALGHEQGVGWRRIVYLCTRIGYSMMVLIAADRILKNDNADWWRRHDKGECIRRAAERVAKEPEAPWSAINYFHFADRFFGSHQVGRMLGFKSRRYPMPGNHATPFQGHVLQTATRESTFAPSYHFVTDLATDEAWTNLPGGPSESRFSRYYKNDIPRWVAGQYKLLRPEAT
jgi:penicillin amidase